jgi:hypothetical protein
VDLPACQPHTVHGDTAGIVDALFTGSEDALDGLTPYTDYVLHGLTP